MNYEHKYILLVDRLAELEHYVDVILSVSDMINGTNSEQFRDKHVREINETAARMKSHISNMIEIF